MPTATFQEKLLLRITQFPGITDRELTEQILGKGTHPSRVNQEARLLENLKRINRRQRPDGRVGNYPVGGNDAANKVESAPPARYEVSGPSVCPVDIPELREALVEVTRIARGQVERGDIEITWSPAPHKKPGSLPPNSQAVYCFFIGTKCIKCGKAGPKSTARYNSQHYGMDARSTLAKSILIFKDRILELLKKELHEEFAAVNESNIGRWLEANTGRLNVLIPTQAGPHVLSLVEAFLHVRFQPLFEGHG